MFFHEQHQCIANLPFLFDKGRVDCPVVCAYFILQQLTMLHQPKKSLQLQVVRGFGEKSNFSAHLPGKASKGGKKKQQKNTENTQLCKKSANCAILKLWILHETANYLPPTLSRWQSRSLVQKNAAKRRKM